MNRGSGEVSLWGVRIRYLRVSLDESRISRVGDGEDGNGEMGKGGEMLDVLGGDWREGGKG